MGGNALGSTPEQQMELVKQTAETIVDLVEDGYDVIIGHGNGPQVGMVSLAFDYSYNNGGGTPALDFPECGAMTQGYIGYHLQQAIQNELKKRNLKKNVASVVTQVVVNRDDPAFENPTKPVGMFLTKQQADQLAEERGYVFREDSGRGYRRVVPSPIPVRIVEIDLIRELVDNHNIVITVGGGGIPVTEENGRLTGIASVIDKDRACCQLALDLDADILMILTAVEKVSLNYRKENQVDLDELTVEEAEKYMKDNQFGVGSMLPKVESCLNFVKNKENGHAIIAALKSAKMAISGQTGTKITK